MPARADAKPTLGYAVDQVRRGADHATGRTRRAEATRLARECDESLVATVAVTHAHEAAAEQTAGEDLVELALDEARIAEATVGAVSRVLDHVPRRFLQKQKSRASLRGDFVFLVEPWGIEPQTSRVRF